MAVGLERKVKGGEQNSINYRIFASHFRMGDAKRTLTRCRSRMHLSISETIANNPLPFLPEELIVKILLKLPVKSLLQFKCVCKLWKTLISNTQFANNHLLSSTAYPRLVTSVTTSRSWEVKSYPIESLLQNSSTTVIPVTFRTGTSAV